MYGACLGQTLNRQLPPSCPRPGLVHTTHLDPKANPKQQLDLEILIKTCNIQNRLQHVLFRAGALLKTYQNSPPIPYEYSERQHQN